MQLLTTDFWFAAYPAKFSPLFDKGFFALFVIVALAGLGLRIASRSKVLHGLQRRLFVDTAFASYWLAMFGLFWWFCTREEVRFFGQRFWFVLWVMLAVWVYVRAYRGYKMLPKQMAAQKERAEAGKFQPRRSR